MLDPALANRNEEAKREAKQYMAQLDTDGDGMISKEEFTTDLVDLYAEESEGTTADAENVILVENTDKAAALKLGHEKFGFADINGDGKLDDTEYLVLHAPGE